MSERKHQNPRPLALAQEEHELYVDRFSVGLALKRAQHELRLALNAELALIGSNISQINVLSMIEKHPGISSADLARLSFLTPQTLGQQVIQLQECGLVKRSPGDGRRIGHTLTKKGRQLLAVGTDTVREVDTKVLRDFAEGDIESLLDAFRTIERRAGEVRAETRRFVPIRR